MVGVIGLPGLALLARDGLHARINQRPGFRVRLERHTQGGCGALARVVVWRGADAAGAEHRVARGEGAAQRGGDARRLVAYVFGPGQRLAVVGQDFDALGQVFVAAAAREDFIADDDEAEHRGVHGLSSYGCSCSQLW